MVFRLAECLQLFASPGHPSKELRAHTCRFSPSSASTWDKGPQEVSKLGEDTWLVRWVDRDPVFSCPPSPANLSLFKGQNAFASAQVRRSQQALSRSVEPGRGHTPVLPLWALGLSSCQGRPPHEECFGVRPQQGHGTRQADPLHPRRWPTACGAWAPAVAIT